MIHSALATPPRSWVAEDVLDDVEQQDQIREEDVAPDHQQEEVPETHWRALSRVGISGVDRRWSSGLPEKLESSSASSRASGSDPTSPAQRQHHPDRVIRPPSVVTTRTGAPAPRRCRSRAPSPAAELPRRRWGSPPPRRLPTSTPTVSAAVAPAPIAASVCGAVRGHRAADGDQRGEPDQGQRLRIEPHELEVGGAVLDDVLVVDGQPPQHFGVLQGDLLSDRSSV